MRKPRLPPGTPDDTEHAFYEALQQADLSRLMACWADEDDIVCVLPGGQRLLGHAAVRAAFEVLLAHGGIKAVPEQMRRLDAGNCSVHSVLERVELQGHDGPDVAWVLATNVYAKTAQGWRMVAHHASPGIAADPSDRTGVPTLLH
jgi:ketosteroid isomerase-like protein